MFIVSAFVSAYQAKDINIDTPSKKFELDFNGDGFADLVMGAERVTGNAGAIYILLGTSNFPCSINASSSHIIFTGEVAEDRFGGSISKGDFNGDGVDDIIAGARLNDDGGGNVGKVYIFYGSRSITPGRAPIVRSASSANVRITGVGISGGEEFGQEVTGVGDINNDGIKDFTVTDYEGGSTTVKVFHGKKGLHLITNAKSANQVITGTNSFGLRVSPVGDVNSDGIDDFIVSSKYAIHGKAYIFFGSSNPPAARNQADANVILTGTQSFGYRAVAGGSDVNGDGISDIIVGDSLANAAYIFFGDRNLKSKSSAEANVTLTGTVTGERFGSSVSFLGDVNGDRIGDFLVSTVTTAKAYIFFGARKMKNKSSSSANVELIAEADDFGFGDLESTGTIGDFNGDGIADFAVSSITSDRNGSNSGAVYFFFGKKRLSHFLPVMNANLIIEGAAALDFFGTLPND